MQNLRTSSSQRTSATTWLPVAGPRALNLSTDRFSCSTSPSLSLSGFGSGPGLGFGGLDDTSMSVGMGEYGDQQWGIRRTPLAVYLPQAAPPMFQVTCLSWCSRWCRTVNSSFRQCLSRNLRWSLPQVEQAVQSW